MKNGKHPDRLILQAAGTIGMLLLAACGASGDGGNVTRRRSDGTVTPDDGPTYVCGRKSVNVLPVPGTLCS